MKKSIKSMTKIAFILALAAGVIFGSACSSLQAETSENKITGYWESSITVPNQGQVKLIFEFFINADGEYRGFLTVPQQSELPLFIQNVKLEGMNLNVTLENIGASYSGKLADNSIEGEFKQGEGSFPLVLERVK